MVNVDENKENAGDLMVLDKQIAVDIANEQYLSVFDEKTRNDILEKQDCSLDDYELLDSKKHLMSKYTPISICNALQGKHKNIKIDIAPSEFKDPDNLKFTKFACQISLEMLEGPYQGSKYVGWGSD